jgi:transcription initiation factor TFIIIB Brf1 subunit/transcription initiation factor TFIIB
MKLCIKKIYCPYCRQAVSAQEQSSNGQDRIVCSKCGQAICIGNGIYWRQAQEGETMSSKDADGRFAGKAKKTKLSRN